MKLISIIIPVRNRKEYTQHILSQIYEQISKINKDNISVIVVDDGSTDSTQEMILTQFSAVHLIQGDGSLWWTGAICLGMKYAIEKLASDYLIWLNDDISLAEDFIIKVNEICADPLAKEAVIGGIIQDKNYPDWIVFSGLINKKPIRSLEDFGTEKKLEVDALNGNITVIPQTVVDKIGLPDPIRFPHYGGDYEFTMRAKKSGFKVILSSQLQAITDYQITDFIRYMSPLMQWHIESDKSKRKDILKGFTSFKSNYNIWHMVNIIHCESKNIPKWKYAVYYIRQILKLVLSDFFPIRDLKGEIDNYLKQQNAPAAIAEAIRHRRSSR